MTIVTRPDRRSRRVAAKVPRRRRSWTALVASFARTLAVLTLAGFLGYHGAEVALNAPTFEIDRVIIRGNQRLSTGEVVGLLSGLRGQNILQTDLAEWRSRVLQSRWVGDAILRRTLPSTIEIAILERVPIGIARFGPDLYLVDARGGIIDEHGPHYADFDLPIIDGLTGGTGPEEPAAIDAARARLAARLLDAVAVREDLASRISQVDVADARNAILILEGDPARIQVGDDQFVERLQAYLEVAPAVRERVPLIDYIDLRFDERMYVRPGSATGQGRSAVTRTARATPRF